MEVKLLLMSIPLTKPVTSHQATPTVDHKHLLKIFGDRCLNNIPNPCLHNLITDNTGMQSFLDTNKFQHAMSQHFWMPHLRLHLRSAVKIPASHHFAGDIHVP
ncbi:hypothetical protein PoB_000338400 [Plakobranchus ocellatus]|uniref:Uncharacterized protein n=1 Tax=Plakobranchus ocellatus TaxID=259542 RepID=A0AAV3Y3S8_9GAST|nr:hypothetical protein PoB_000338400 [Plakobranchus ocellatus]